MEQQSKKLAIKSEVPEGKVKQFIVNGLRVVLCNSNNHFYAVGDLCTHDGGPLGEGELIEGQVECPRHGARFDIHTGKATCLPAVMPIPTYKIEQRGEELWISLPFSNSDQIKDKTK